MKLLSIIIPHKNTPDLLQRCIDSVPCDNNIEIIIVDDNSDESVVNFNHFPGQNRENVNILFSKEGKGAGYARNLGLDQATGNWVTFMDSDDLFSEMFGEILAFTTLCDSDIIYTNVRFVDSEDVTREVVRSGSSHIQDCFAGYKKGQISETVFRYEFPALWGKIIRRSLISKHNIRFDEVRWANDVYFSTQAGCLAEKITVLDEVLYIATRRKGSLTYNFLSSEQEYLTRLGEALKSEQFLKQHNVKENPLYAVNIMQGMYKNCGQWEFFKIMWRNRSNSAIFRSMFSYYCGSRFDAIKRLITR